MNGYVCDNCHRWFPEGYRHTCLAKFVLRSTLTGKKRPLDIRPKKEKVG